MPVAPVHAADNSLDFDLDGLSFDTPAKPIAAHAVPAAHLVHTDPVVPVVPAEPVDEAPLSALDFDFLPVTPAAPESNAKIEPMPAVTAMGPSATAAEPVNEASLNFGEFGSPAPPALHPEFAHAIQPVVLPDLPPAALTDIAPQHPAKSDATEFNMPFVAPADPQPLEFDLSGITLDLPESQPHETHAGSASGMPGHRFDSAANTGAMRDDFSELDLTTVADHDDGASNGGISNSAEMATKLDLAVAYQEIGDQEGARELLDEVVKGGSAPQSEKARSLLARLG